MKKKMKYYCKESGCNNEISISSALYGQGKCQTCANRISSFIDGRTTEKYFCKEEPCNNKICYTNFKYGSGKCMSCAKKGTILESKWNNILTKKFLKKEYIINKKSTLRIAKEIKSVSSTINTYLKKYNIKKRNKSEASRIRRIITKHNRILTKFFLIKEYIDLKKSSTQIAKENKCTKKTVLNYLKKFEIPSRSNSESNRGLLKGKKHWNWQGGISFEPYTHEFNDELKLKIRKRDNFTCQKCNITEEEHLIVYGIVLCVHHINYNKQNCKENNLITLCNECNLRVNSNRQYWKKYFKQLILVLE